MKLQGDLSIFAQTNRN